MADTLRNEIFRSASIGEETGLYLVSPDDASPEASVIPQMPMSYIDSLFRDETGEFSGISEGDVVWVDKGRGLVRTVLSSVANANTLLLTERCDNYCQFCSQPPNEKPDSHLYERAFLSLEAFRSDEIVGLSGGEPTINKAAFLTLLKNLNDFNIPTPLHILTNGRSFSDASFTSEVFDLIKERDVLWGVPLYGHHSSLHDGLVQADGAFLDTIAGLQRMLAKGARVELRIVPVQRNLAHLPHIVQFVSSALGPVEWISIMNMEPKGFARKNFDDLFVPVRSQSTYLSEACAIAGSSGVPVHLFNYPLCLLPVDLRDLAVMSISDWKNYYPDGCNECALREGCGGFFASATGKFIEDLEPVYER